jgi:hypothetical protein
MAEDKQDICPHMNDNCKNDLGGVLIDFCSDWLAAHGTDLDEEKGNDAVREVLTRLLNNLPTAEQLREMSAMVASTGGQLGDA